ncbi:MAG: cell division FtsA domain-containing protein [Bacillota bacterium]
MHRIFALDIGTRKVAGLVVEPEGQRVRIIAVALEEHAGRSMFDGQVHDVPQVAEVVRRVTDQLETMVGHKLPEVFVAAAGRSLRTVTASAERRISPLAEISDGQVPLIELEAVQVAARQLDAELGRGGDEFHCVGYSTVGYTLNGSPIGNLVGQRGRSMGAQVVATFLPRVVLDSMVAVLERAGLETAGLTLEPIAALNAVIPPTMRRLNLALVDVGAGTSDIAITRNGTVLAYGMVPIAGDEVTERLAAEFLLDFPEAERAKRELDGGPVTIRDVLGGTQQVPTELVVERIAPAVEELASGIAATIKELNAGPPQAVMLVGGGSQTPGLRPMLAAQLGLPEGRVAVQGPNALYGFTGSLGPLEGPLAITPVGIALMARGREMMGFTNVYVNGRLVRLLRLGEGNVGEALVAAGVRVSDIHGRPGPALSVEVNGKPVFIPGTLGRPGVIRVNGEEAHLTTPIRDRDRIEIEPGQDGDPGQGTVGQVAPAGSAKTLVFQGMERVVGGQAIMNGRAVLPDEPLEDGAKIICEHLERPVDALRLLGLGDGQPEVLRYQLNGVPREARLERYVFRVNGEPVPADHRLREGDRLEVIQGEQGLPQASLLDGHRPAATRVRVNGEWADLPAKPWSLEVNGRPVAADTLVKNGDEVWVREGATSLIFADLLAAIEFEAKPPSGRHRLVTRLNGRTADFSTPVKDGDEAEVFWEPI